MNRRKFLGTSASLFATVSVGSSYLGVALPASAQVGGARREVVVGGRRVKTVDVHSHTIIRGAMELIGETTPENNELLVIGPDRIRRMDELGIDVEVLSINPFWYGLDYVAARRVIEYQNESLAEHLQPVPRRAARRPAGHVRHPS